MNRSIDRRDFLKRSSMGFGMLSLRNLMQGNVLAGDSPLAPRIPHFAPKARSVIFLYMDGGVSQVDSFDPKPQLDKENGQLPKFKTDATVFNSKGNLLKSPWEFKNYGQSGLPVSGLFPHIGSCADDLCVIRSMTAFSPNHPNANYALHCGHVLSGPPEHGCLFLLRIGHIEPESPELRSHQRRTRPPGGLVQPSAAASCQSITKGPSSRTSTRS